MLTDSVIQQHAVNAELTKLNTEVSQVVKERNAILKSVVDDLTRKSNKTMT